MTPKGVIPTPNGERRKSMKHPYCPIEDLECPYYKFSNEKQIGFCILENSNADCDAYDIEDELDDYFDES